MLASDDPRPLQDHQQDRQKERCAKAEDETRAEVQVIADARQCLLLDAADIALIAQQKMKRPRHCCEICEASTRDEKDGRHQQEWQERLLFLHVEAGCNEAPELRRDHREAQHDRREQCDLHLREESFENVGVDQLALPGPDQRLDQNGENILRVSEADEERDEKRRQTPKEPPPELDQMLKQRLLCVVDVPHGSGRFSTGS